MERWRGVVPGGLGVVEAGRRKRDPEVEVLGGEEVVAGETGRRTRRTNGDQGEEVEMIVGGMMMGHLPGVVHHHPEEVLLLEEILETGTEVAPGGLAPQEMILPGVEIGIVVVLEEVGGTLEREEVLLPGECLQEEDLLPEETLEEMMTAEEVLLAVHLLKVELGAAEVVTDLLLEEDLHQDAALLPEEDHHLGA